MKKTTLYIIALLGLVALSSCRREDPLSEESVITVANTEENAFDRWLEVNYVDAYNIQFIYRYDEVETNMDYYTVPATFEASVKMAHLLKHVLLEAYDEVGGIDFTRENFPKMVCCTGEWLYKSNGTYVGGSAEGGRKINLEGLNYIDAYVAADKLNTTYMHTVHHEFTHILNQKKSYPTSFQEITGTFYVGGVWSDSPYSAEKYYLSHGFVSAYSQQEQAEDFAEVLGTYVTYTDKEWNMLMERASADTEYYNDKNGTELEDGAVVINTKLEAIKDYMMDSWNIDVDELRASVLRRDKEVMAGVIDLMDLTVEE